jgi:DNA polymerase-3 subunit delta'
MWNVIGQPKAVGFLQYSVESDRLAHAYLFVGPPHVGKSTLATNLAQALNCERGREPCGQCRACERIAAGKHADVRIIGRVADAGSAEGDVKKEIGIGQIRELQQSAGLQPYEGKNRVFVIDGAEYLNEESANCLLKILEEPPPAVVIILLAVSDAGLFPTVVSRCQRVELFPVSAEIVERALREHWGVESDKARILSRLCQGGIGWAVSASLDERILQARSLRLAELQGLAGASLEQRFEFGANLAARFSRNRDAVEEVLGLWMGWWRDLLLTKAGCGQFVVNVDHEAGLTCQADDYALSEIRGFIEAIREALAQLEQNANPRLVLEVLMLSVPHREEGRTKRTAASVRRDD